MASRLGDDAGVRLVWYIDPATRTAQAYRTPDQGTAYGEADRLPRGDVLPGFELPFADVFTEIDQSGQRA